MSKELDYVNEKIKDLEFKIAHPREYQISPLGKVRINDGAVFKEELEILKSIKQRLEAIDNANPSEALGELNEIEERYDMLEIKYVFGNPKEKPIPLLNFNTIKQALIKAQEQEELLKILKDSPFILQKIFENKELKNQEQYDKKYFWGTITEDKVIKIKGWLDNEEKD